MTGGHVECVDVPERRLWAQGCIEVQKRRARLSRSSRTWLRLGTEKGRESNGESFNMV